MTPPTRTPGQAVRRLDLVVGPNGAGKSTFIRLTLAPSLPPGTPLVNADEIAGQRWPEDPGSHAYEAARVAAATRDALVQQGRSFIAETVFSHPSKLDLVDRARAAGFEVFLHVLLVPEELTVRRVALRVAAGGHAVDEQKIRARFHRLWPLALAAAERCEATTVYDNSARTGPRIVAQLASGSVVGDVARPPWSPAELAAAWA